MEALSSVKAVWIASAIAASPLLLQANDFTLKQFALGRVITLHTTLTQDGKGARLIATAKNESGAPIQHTKICIFSAAIQKRCLFEMWNTRPWAPGEELTWNMTTGVKTSNLAHGASLLEFDGGKAAQQPAQSASAPAPLHLPLPTPAPTPAPIQSRLRRPVEAPSSRRRNGPHLRSSLTRRWSSSPKRV